jgi:methyl-accepting chemotaxis protein
MKDMSLNVHVRKVTKVLLIVLWVVAVPMFLSTLFGGSHDKASGVPDGLLFKLLNSEPVLGAVITTILFFKRYDNAAGIMLCSTFMANGLVGTLTNMGSQDATVMGFMINFFTIILSGCLMALYLNHKNLAIFIGMSDALLLLTEFVFKSIPISQFVIFFIFSNLCFLSLFFVTKWGAGMLKSSQKREQETAVILEQLKDVMDKIESNSKILNKDINDCNSNLQIVQESGNGIIVTVQEVSKGVSEQTGSITDISNMVSSADDNINETLELSSQMSEVSHDTNSIVMEGSEHIKEMSRQMNIISDVVKKTLSTVSELHKSMDKINVFLDGITQISEQTNLLSLNAAIEAARAGEQGKGFAVVAEEVRKLADQSSETVKLINKVIVDIRDKTQMVLEEAQSGMAAAETGEKIVSKVNTSFGSIEASFKKIDECIEMELDSVKKTTAVINEIRKRAEDIASIAEQHSASTEEMLATVEDQNININKIFHTMKDIQKSSLDLESAIKQ